MNNKYIFHYYTDIRIPAREQVNDFRKVLTIWRNSSVKIPNSPPQKRWPLLWRVLDAHAAGVTNSEIGRKLANQVNEPAKYGARLTKEALKAQIIIGRIFTE